DASGMVLSVGAPANPVEPYSSYAVGALASDDFSSFTLTFTASDLSAVPVILQWKDADGNTLTTTKTLDLRSLAASGGTGSRSGSSATGAARGGGLSSFYPLIAGGVVIIIAIVFWMKRKWIVAKFRKQ
ncbi:MAG: hypothetical protein ABSE13_12960, partial [Methanoregula sp.]